MKYSLCMLLLFVSTLLPAGAQSFVKVNRNRTVTVSARFPKADEVRLRGSLAVEIKRSNLIKRLNGIHVFISQTHIRYHIHIIDVS